MSHIEIAKKVIAIEAASVAGLGGLLDGNFDNAVNSIRLSSGRVVVCGMGKSGIIGKKIAATLASTGTPSFFMHPAEAYHGDLGMVGINDMFFALSNSGETDEVLKLIPFLKSRKNFLISMTGSPESSLARFSDVHLNVRVDQEACPLQLAPTSSTTAALVMGDALAVALMNARDFRPDKFARCHPGRRLLGLVEDEMVTEGIEILPSKSGILDLIKEISSNGLGLCLVENDGVLGVVTDGDVRRMLDKFGEKFLSVTANDVVSWNPSSVNANTRIEDAMQLMSIKNISSLLVMRDGKFVGIFRK
jgi:arabinose-5-phosphate isomerase